MTSSNRVHPNPEKSASEVEVVVTNSSNATGFGVTCQNLREFMEIRGDDALTQLKNRYVSTAGLVSLLSSNLETGLSGGAKDLEQRRKAYGRNSIPQKKQKPFWKYVLDAARDPILIILMVSAAVSLGVSFIPFPADSGSCLANAGSSGPNNSIGPPPNHPVQATAAVSSTTVASSSGGSDNVEWVESISIMLAVILVIFIGSGMDYSKQQEFRKLQDKINTEHTSYVLRNGAIQTLPVADLVVGDICLVKYGDLLPADGIVIQSSDLRTDESSLTGESDQLSKSVQGDIMLLSGTHVVEGSGRMLVLAVGPNSQAGIIFSLLADKDDDEEEEQEEENKDKKKPKDGAAAAENGEGGTIEEEEPDEEKEDEDDVPPVKSHKSILQDKLDDVAEMIGKGGMIFGVLTSAVLIIRFCAEVIPPCGWSNTYWLYIIQYIIIGLTVLVVAIPEGLPLAVTLALAYSVRQMIKDNNMVRHIDATETMGSATTICSDKTGTLTTNRMTCVRSYVGGKLFDHPNTAENSPATIPATVEATAAEGAQAKMAMTMGHPIPSNFNEKFMEILSEGIAVNSGYTSSVDLPSAATGGLPVQKGNKTECALLYYIMRMGANVQEIRDKNPESSFYKLYTFNSARKFMATVLNKGDGFNVHVKGASERLLERCTNYLDAQGGTQSLSSESKLQLETVIDGMANDGMRTIVAGFKVVKDMNWGNDEDIVKDLTLVAICGIEDPVRGEVPKAIRLCQSAGITVRMVTGDNINTARSIAQKCGILQPGDKRGLILDGKTFNDMIRENGQVSQAKLDEVWPRLRVLARSSPTDKHTLVTGIMNSKLKKNRDIVAVTGDGTNDAPALKAADVGFAMGIAGTDVAKEACDIIVTDDNFSSIVKAVMWGRNVHDSVCKFLQFQMTVNVVAVLIAFFGAVLFKSSPLKGIQMLWVNLVMDTFASLALATEQPSEELLYRQPEPRTASVISPKMWRFIVGNSIYQLGVLFIFLYVGPTFLLFQPSQCPGKQAGDPVYGCKSALNLDPQDAEGATVHFTLVFNVFVLMTLTNQINARKLFGEKFVFGGIHRNFIFNGIVIGELVVHAIIVQVGKPVFLTVALTWQQWLICGGFALGQFPWYVLICFFPVDALMEVLKQLFQRCRPQKKSKRRRSSDDGNAAAISRTSLRAAHRRLDNTGTVTDDYTVAEKVMQSMTMSRRLTLWNVHASQQSTAAGNRPKSGTRPPSGKQQQQQQERQPAVLQGGNRSRGSSGNRPGSRQSHHPSETQPEEVQ